MVYITGSATTKFGEFFEASLLDLLEEATVKALNEAQTQLADIEAIYLSNMLASRLQNLQQLGSQLAGRLHVKIPIYFYEAACASGGVAIHHAWKDLTAGFYEKVLVVGGEKMTEVSPDLANQGLMQAASEQEQLTGISFCGLYALMAKSYCDQYQVPIEDLAYASALMHQQGLGSKNAHFVGKSFTPEQINSSRMIASPLTLLQCSPLSDGAAAVVLQRQETNIKIAKSGVACDTPGLAQRESIMSIPATKAALKKLNLDKDWPASCAAVEIHDCFSIALVMGLEDLGLCEKGEGTALLKTLWETPNTVTNTPIINATGGLKAGGHPVGATGIKQIHTLYQALKNKKTGSTALAHNIGGTGGTAVLHMLEKC